MNLKPCPFCGCFAGLHEDRSIFQAQMWAYRVECEGHCHAMTCYWHTKKQAVEAWNRRTPAAGRKEILDEMARQAVADGTYDVVPEGWPVREEAK